MKEREDLVLQLEGLMCRFCVECRQDFRTHKEFLHYWHDQFANEGYDILNKLRERASNERD